MRSYNHYVKKNGDKAFSKLALVFAINGRSYIYIYIYIPYN